jgi:RHS repeat-associated protein
VKKVQGVGTHRYVGAYGCRYDADTGLTYMRQRWYDAPLQRFVGRDPVPHLNNYSYANNRPTTYVDPSGALVILFVPVVVTGLGIFFGAVYKSVHVSQELSAERAGVPEEQILAALKFFKNRADRDLASKILHYYQTIYPKITNSHCGLASQDARFQLEQAFQNTGMPVIFSLGQESGSEFGLTVPINYTVVKINGVEIDLYTGADQSLGPIFRAVIPDNYTPHGF